MEENQIFADFVSNISGTHGLDYLNVYWRNETIAIRTPPLTATDSSDKKVLRIVNIRRNN